MSCSDFIGVYERVFSPEYCQDVINFIDSASELGYGSSRQQAQDGVRHQKDDYQITPAEALKATFVLDEEYNHEFNEKFWGTCYADYASTFSVLNDLPSHAIHGNKLQRTKIGQGYHLWHSEISTGDMMGRLLAYIVYLNDVEEGGETEFLYQHKRVKPTQGTVVIFPAGFTHTHRGNPPISNTKYIMTGWVEF